MANNEFDKFDNSNPFDAFDNQSQSSAYVPMSAASSLPPTWSPTVQGQKVKTVYDQQAKGYLTTGANGAELMVVRQPFQQSCPLMLGLVLIPLFHARMTYQPLHR